MSDNLTLAALLQRARQLAAAGEDETAKAVYLDLLHRDPTYFAALNELGGLAYASGHRSAARTAYEQAVRCHPDNPLGRVNLGNLLTEEGDLAAARLHYEAALAAGPAVAEAHQGLARVLSELGEAARAASHWQQGFAGHAVVERPYRGRGSAPRVLLLVAARGGNIPTRQILDDRLFAVTALHADFFDPAAALPPHDVVFNAIGDADLCMAALETAETMLARTTAPVINAPASVRATGRAENAARLGALAGVITPAIRRLPRAAIPGEALRYPLLLRAPGFHTGRHFQRVDQPEALAAALAALPGDELLAIDYLDARGAAGLFRKYRVMIIGGALYPLHLAISRDWKVHYFTAAMAGNAAHREEERRFLEDMPAVLGVRALAALQAIGATVGLDYAGVDFGLRADGALLLFEANATMVINPPEPDPIWDYRQAPIARALEAAQRLVRGKASAALKTGR